MISNDPWVSQLFANLQCISSTSCLCCFFLFFHTDKLGHVGKSEYLLRPKPKPLQIMIIGVRKLCLSIFILKGNVTVDTKRKNRWWEQQKKCFSGKVTSHNSCQRRTEDCCLYQNKQQSSWDGVQQNLLQGQGQQVGKVETKAITIIVICHTENYKKEMAKNHVQRYRTI